MSHSIRIVLVATSHPGNIGAAARALKNMALDELVLVRPRLFPHPEASARASTHNCTSDPVPIRITSGAARTTPRSALA